MGIENLNGKEHGQFEKKIKLGAQNFVLNFKVLEELLPSNYKLDESRWVKQEFLGEIFLRPS